MPLIKKISSEFKRNHIYLRSAALTYTTLFAIVPLSLITFFVFANLPFGQALDKNLEQLISQNFLPISAKELSYYLDKLTEQAYKLTYVGSLILIVTVVLLLRNIESTFNEICQVKNKRPKTKRFLIYLLITFIGPFLLAMSASFHSFFFSFGFIDELANLLSTQPTYLKWIPLVFSAFAFSLIYIIIPNTRVPVVYGVMGGTIVALIFELARNLFGLFIQTFNSYDLIYGAFAFVPIFLMWIHLSWIIILTGLIFVKVMYR